MLHTTKASLAAISFPFFLSFYPFFCPIENCKSQEALSGSWQVGREGRREGGKEISESGGTKRWRGREGGRDGEE